MLHKLNIGDKLEELNTNKKFVDTLLNNGNKTKSENLKKQLDDQQNIDINSQIQDQMK